METTTQPKLSPEAIKWLDAQQALQKALSEVNTSRGLPSAAGRPWTKEEALAQGPAVQEIIARVEREIAVLKDALLEVDFARRLGYLDAYLES
jgi:hypothetical protein